MLKCTVRGVSHAKNANLRGEVPVLKSPNRFLNRIIWQISRFPLKMNIVLPITREQ